jgi:hypothetical protein
MIPSASHVCWKKLITGEKDIRSSNLSFNMLLFNLRLRYKKDGSPMNLVKLVYECHEFFVKYAMLLKSETEAIQK